MLLDFLREQETLQVEKCEIQRLKQRKGIHVKWRNGNLIKL